MVLGCLAPAASSHLGLAAAARYQVGLELEVSVLPCLGLWGGGWAGRGLTWHIYLVMVVMGLSLPLSHCSELLSL